ncbi:MAG TPA: phosphotransferase [Nitrospirales bacterium]|nr:phosphotransferase [Nitrospirales bacterium]
MSSHQSVVFQYIKIPNENKRFFCLQQNILVLAWMLFFIKDSLTPIVRPDSQISRVGLLIKQMHSYLGFVKRNVSCLSFFGGYKLQLLSRQGVVELPCYGQICVPIHKGYKVFDFHRGIAIKVFDHDVNASAIRDEIEKLKVVSKIEFASSIKKWSIEERWYEEEYVNGALDSSYKPLDSVALLEKFFNEIIQYLTHLILFQKPISKNAVEHALDRNRELRSKLSSKPTFTGSEHQRITLFIDSIMNRLQTEGNCPIFLVFAHGDFVPANMLNTQHGMKIIDWEGAGYWSALFDFYSYFFYRPACREVPVSMLGSEVMKALPMFISKLTEHAPEVSSSLKAQEKTYRWIFYIEMIYRLVDRQMTDTNLDVMHYIQEYIKAFNLYEELAIGKNV